MKRRGIMIGLAAILTGGITLTLWAADLTLDQVPQRAKAMLLKLAGPNTITEVEAEKEGGIEVYEASWKVDGREVEAEVTADGTLLEMEETVAAEDVPDAVRAAAEQALAGAAKIHFEKHTVITYEAEARIDGKEKEVTISPAGKIAGQPAAGQPVAADDSGDDGDDDEGEDDADDDEEDSK